MLSDSIVEFAEEEVCSYNNGSRWLCSWIVFPPEWRLLLFGMMSCFVLELPVLIAFVTIK